MRTTLVLAILFFAVACQSTSKTEAPCTAENNRVSGGALCLVAYATGVDGAGASPTLAVILHGDVSRGGRATYQMESAREIGRMAGVVSVALIRPGYVGETGDKSDGTHKGRRDHYTDENNLAIGEAIRALKARYKASRVVVMGHSGGAAQAGVIIGRFPGLVDHAVLVSCPCDIPRWRASRGARPWPTSQSPIDFADGVAKTTSVTAITGGSDGNTGPGLAEDYVAALSGRGINARFILAGGVGHGFNGLWPTVRENLGL